MLNLYNNHNFSTGTPCPLTGTIDDMSGIFSFIKCNLYGWRYMDFVPDIKLADLLRPIVHKNTKENCRSEVFSTS